MKPITVHSFNSMDSSVKRLRKEIKRLQFTVIMLSIALVMEILERWS